MERTQKEYLDICQGYIDYYHDKLHIYPDKIQHKYIKPDHLGWAYNNNAIIYNRTFTHNEDFYNILYQEFTPEEEEKEILEN